MEKRRSIVVVVIIAAILTIIIVGSMIIIDEVDSSFKAFLNSLTGHHWVTKSVFTVVLFPLFSVIFYVLFRLQRVRSALHADNIWGWTTALVIITIFFYLSNFVNYIIHYFAF
jgi:hypothetical protein